MESPARRLVVGSLIGLALALLLVGLVSGTVLRHIVQIVPIMVVLAVVRRRPDWGAYAAIPIFVFWIFIVVLIWLFLLGLSRIANGHYTPIEVLSTFLMMACSIVGVVKSVSWEELYQHSDGHWRSSCSPGCTLRPCGSAS
jgi:hypothetical protein